MSTIEIDPLPPSAPLDVPTLFHPDYQAALAEIEANGLMVCSVDLKIARLALVTTVGSARYLLEVAHLGNYASDPYVTRLDNSRSPSIITPFTRSKGQVDDIVVEGSGILIQDIARPGAKPGRFTTTQVSSLSWLPKA